MPSTSTATSPPTRKTVAAVSLASIGLIAGAAVTFLVVALIGGGVAGSYTMAAKIVDAIMAGATIAAVAGLLLGAGLGTAVFYTVRWAIGFYGRKKAIA